MDFQRETILVNGVRVVMLTAGSGEPLVFWHGAGAWHGFDFAEPWTSRFRVMIPFHPGWGESGDAPEMSSVDDYMLHYLEMFDQLELQQVNLVGLSMGGRFAATFAIQHRERVRKLVLVAPAGLEVPEHPMANLSQVPLQEIPAYLVHNYSVIEKHLPKAFGPGREREGENFGKLMQSGLVGPWLTRWLHRIDMPTLLVWGEKDRIIPIGQAEVWKKLIPQAQILRVADAGHLPLDEKPEASRAVADFLR